MKDIIQPLINKFIPFAKKRMGFNKPPRIFLRNDPNNAKDPLGKTAYYDPQEMSVTLFTHGRHPKDVMRSLSHELVHHTQNCNGEFDQTKELGDGYAQNDKHLREMERQAYEQGNMCFRDWEDSIKGTIYIQNMNVDILKEGNNDMSIKDWKNNELKTLLSERWGFSFNLINESQEDAIEEKEEVVEEGGAALRVGNEDRLEQRHAHPDRIHEEEEKEEEEVVEEGEDKKTPYDDGDGKDEKCDHVPCKDQDGKKKGTNEAKIRELVLQLVKEAVKRSKK